MKTYTVFIRDWYVRDASGRIVPGPGEQDIVAEGCTWAEARRRCDEYNDSHEPGELSRKMEFISE